VSAISVRLWVCFPSLIPPPFHHTALGLSFGMTDFARTKEGKPFIAATTCDDKPPVTLGACSPSTHNPGDDRRPEAALQKAEVQLDKYNLNLSHHGDWVVVASDHAALVGVCACACACACACVRAGKSSCDPALCAQVMRF
jgi:hypothetical protein